MSLQTTQAVSLQTTQAVSLQTTPAVSLQTTPAVSQQATPGREHARLAGPWAFTPARAGWRTLSRDGAP